MRLLWQFTPRHFSPFGSRFFGLSVYAADPRRPTYLQAPGASPPHTGIAFVTYSLLARRDHLQQLLQWCGEDFDGVVALDEAHCAKKIKSKSGNAVLQLHVRRRCAAPMRLRHSRRCAAVSARSLLQSALPSAAMLYASATAASAIDEMQCARPLTALPPALPCGSASADRLGSPDSGRH